MKICSVCKQSKSLDNFHNVKAYKDGKANRCKCCDYEAGCKYKKDNPERYKDSRRNVYLKFHYGISYKEFKEMSILQNDVCLICGEKNKTWRLAVDHNHETGEIRGLLCNLCNRALGFFNDDPSRLRRAADYIESKTH